MDVSVLNPSELMIIVKYALENGSDVRAGEPDGGVQLDHQGGKKRLF